MSSPGYIHLCDLTDEQPKHTFPVWSENVQTTKNVPVDIGIMEGYPKE